MKKNGVDRNFSKKLKTYHSSSDENNPPTSQSSKSPCLIVLLDGPDDHLRGVDISKPLLSHKHGVAAGGEGHEAPVLPGQDQLVYGRVSRGAVRPHALQPSARLTCHIEKYSDIENLYHHKN